MDDCPLPKQRRTHVKLCRPVSDALTKTSACTSLHASLNSVENPSHRIRSSARRPLADQAARRHERHLLAEQGMLLEQQQQHDKQGWWWLAKLEPILMLRSLRERRPLDITVSMPFSMDRCGGGGAGVGISGVWGERHMLCCIHWL